MNNSKRNETIKRLKVVFMVGLVIMALFLLFMVSNTKSKTTRFDVGNPGKGEVAPAINLIASDGSAFDLASFRGQTVLLYFQEGIMCQACWVQLKDIEKNFADFKDVGIDQIVTITTDPVIPLAEVVEMNELQSLVISDRTVSVSKSYNTNLYGMPGMGVKYNGHSFILVDTEGIIQWRADYGRYTMYVELKDLIADIKKGLRQ